MVFNKNIEEIDSPKHYCFWKEKIGIEPKDILKHFDFFTGNILKYIFRAGLKVYQGENARFSKIIDLKKARKYLDFLIDDLEKEIKKNENISNEKITEADKYNF